MDFNPRSREGSDRFCIIPGYFRFNFNPRSREGSDVFGQNHSIVHVLFQSTLPRGERPRYYTGLHRIKEISIHAPARGATTVVRIGRIIVPISIHAPARGATAGGYAVDDILPISIHAPARGATQTRSKSGVLYVISIHAPARGATASNVIPLDLLKFQSTLPRGERPGDRRRYLTWQKFQSTLPRGERPKILYSFINSLQFQSTLPRGERHFDAAKKFIADDFNPRSREGSDDVSAADPADP